MSASQKVSPSQTRENSSLRQRLCAGEKCQGAFLFLASPDIAEIMAGAGFGALIVDREHAAAGHDSALHELRAIRSVSQTPTLVRVSANSPSAIKPMLDAGFDGLLVADLRSADEARALVEAAHYPPLGRRGAQFTVSRAASYGRNKNQYVDETKQNLLVIAMIESRQGLEAIADIAAIDGIDMLFLGPLDLTTDYGPYGDLQSPELHHAMQDAEQRILASGRLLGGAALHPDDIGAMFERGYSFVTSASDTGLLVNAANAAVYTAKKP
ncbi:HpcH/HpaI aldolase family protein [Brucellaceae bacterium C25G]